MKISAQQKEIICGKAWFDLLEYCSENDILLSKIESYQFRLTDRHQRSKQIDIYPISKKTFNLKTKQWGTFENLIGFVMITFV